MRYQDSQAPRTFGEQGSLLEYHVDLQLKESTPVAPF
jgi:hypothetical protein